MVLKFSMIKSCTLNINKVPEGIKKHGNGACLSKRKAGTGSRGTPLYRVPG